MAVAPSEDSTDSIWIIKVVETDCTADTDKTEDSYGNKIPRGFSFLKGQFLEHTFTTKTATIYKLSEELTYFYKETVLYPYVDIKCEKKGLTLTNTELTEIICYVEGNGYAHL